MSRITVTIDRLVLQGIDRADSKALVETLRQQLSQILGDRAARGEWARSRRAPVLKLGRMPLEAGPGGSRKFGASMARAIGRGLKG
jgi:hypothetical protein